MATTEERLAALEAKLAALTATTPTEYYTHQYSGEEIDAAVGRALTGGALDTSVTNVSNQLGTFTRPNLLDNWYFGNPVDQRKGHIQIGGTMMYKDAACTDQFGPSSGTTPVVVYATYARPIDNGVELALYIPLSSIVRGYTGDWVYTIDRWQLANGSMEIDNGITINGDYLFEPLLEVVDSIRGKVVTASILLANNELRYATATIPATWGGWDAIVGGNNGFALQGIGETSERLWFLVSDKSKVLAVKLELGPTQTLAHREGDKWVLNEVPDYGEQLRRCQRYYYQVHYNQYETIGFAYDGPEYAFIIIPLPTEMRGATPTLKIIGDISIGGKVRTLTGCSCHGCEAIIGVNYTAQPSSAGATYAYSTSAGGVTISIIYDL